MITLMRAYEILPDVVKRVLDWELVVLDFCLTIAIKGFSRLRWVALPFWIFITSINKKSSLN
jgi:hypothetical protein